MIVSMFGDFDLCFNILLIIWSRYFY